MRSFLFVFRYELIKILKKKITVVMIILLSVMTLLINLYSVQIYSVGAQGANISGPGAVFQSVPIKYVNDDGIITEENVSALRYIKMQREFALKWKGKALDDALIKDMQDFFDRYRDQMATEKGDEVYLLQNYYWVYRSMYNLGLNPYNKDLSEELIKDLIGQQWYSEYEDQQLTSKEQEFWNSHKILEYPLYIDYAPAYLQLIQFAFWIHFMLIVFAIIVLGESFSVEKRRNTKQVMQTTSKAFSSAVFARFLAGETVVITFSVLLYGLSMLIQFMILGPDGYSMPLQQLVCYKNKITQLDIRKCPKLVNLVKEGTRSEHDGIIEYKDDDGNILAFDKTVNLITGLPTPTPTVAPTTNPTATPSPTAKPAVKPTGAPAEPTKATAVSLALNKKTANVVCGKTLTLKATLTGSSDKITWKSSDTKIATVDVNGKITAKMAGEVTITATAAGKSAKCVVTVLYKDVTNSKDFWYAPTNYLTAKGVVKGYDNQTKFKPANKCTRAQMVTFIWRLQGEPKPKASKCKFSDVKKTDYFYKACIWGNENHIVEGYKNGTFGPQIVCARRHAVTFLWRLAGKPSPKNAKNKFKDVKKSDYFYTATLWASEKKILAGYSDGTFRPNGDCLRRQMVTFLYKYDRYINKKG